MTTRLETALQKMTARVTDALGLDAWLVRGADLAVGYDQPAPVPGAASPTQIAIRLLPETDAGGSPQQGAQREGLEEVAGVRHVETVFRLVAADLASPPTIDDRIVFPDGKNFQVLRVRWDGHAGNQRIAYFVTVRPLEPQLSA